jgi:phage-related protein (TIGR01555 family)
MASPTRDVYKLRAIPATGLNFPMLINLLRKLFRRADPPKQVTEEAKKNEALAVDPLDPIRKQKVWKDAEPTFKLRGVNEFPVWDGFAGEQPVHVVKAIGDAALKLREQGAIMDDGDGTGTGMLKGGASEYTVPVHLQSWYLSQSFIGYQACSIIAQNWLVDKACSMAGEDAARNGWVIKARGGDDLEKPEHDAILQADKEYKIKDNLIELNRFKNVFGIRVAIFKVKSADPLYYEKKFNIDGITPDSYEGISQIDPYWMMPVMTTVGTGDPSAIHFYDPEYWVISGKKYHRSHLVIVRGPQPADILKPTYIFGGISLCQRIYERVYAAERTANEAPLMAMSKRTMAIHADLDKVMADQESFEQRLLTWIRYRDNHGVKVLGKEEAMEQFDTNMSDFDSIIMNQYQLVAAIARVPATKLLGTSPKGFNATGEFEMKSYHEELESIQEHVMMPMLERHYDILCRSKGISTQVEVVCNSVDSITAKERAELNDLKAKTGTELINNGTISPDEERNRIKDDEHSGYNRLEDDSAETTPGMTPENIAKLQTAGAKEEQAGAVNTEASAGAMVSKKGEPGAEGSETDTVEGAGGFAGDPLQALIPAIAQGLVSRKGGAAQIDPTQALLALVLHQIVGQNKPQEGPAIQGTRPGTSRTARPTVVPSSQSTTASNHVATRDAKVVGPMHHKKLPKLRLDGLNIVIENPRGTVREGMNMDGSEWSVEMPDHYGFIKGFDGADGDEVDCFIGKNVRAKDVYVIAQNDSEGEFDEYKCMIGYDSEGQAVEAYHAAHDENFKGFDSCRTMSMDDFKNWLDAGDCALAPVKA